MTSPVSPLDRASALPLWAQLHSDLCRRLADGEFDQAFPGELMLAEEYHISRHTVRDALRRLRSDGLIITGRGQRPRRAEKAQFTQPLGTVYSLFASVEGRGSEQRSIVRAIETRTDGAIATRLGLAESMPLFYLERLRLADEEPLAIDRAWLPGDLAEPLLQCDFTHTSLYAQLAAHTGLRVIYGNEQLFAANPSRDDRALLRADPDEAVFVIKRLGSAGRGPIEWRQTVIRGDRFAVSVDFSTRNGYHLGMSSTDVAHASPPRQKTADNQAARRRPPAHASGLDGSSV